MTTALLIIDMQMGMIERIAAGREHVNPQAPARVAALLALFRARGLPIVHVHHDQPGTPFSAGLRSAEVIPEAAPVAGEVVITKSGSSAFAGTGLDALLRARGIDRIVLCGAVAAFCVTSTTRWASDLGYPVLLASDALMGFDLPRADGSRIDAATVLDVTLTILGADFAEVLPTAAIAARLDDAAVTAA
ncbi:cysteine hydrolase family protein [Frigidibacter sp. SD6-1]|uniref:cysteine hydrolase family protein n=1 Tax=Frigidibacter sp. SD6-1 TaxID=3032581 RepID=UPI0024DFDC6D|nr:cysteine hydrolase family protein [Frigidibacter sp. SD6-1]